MCPATTTRVSPRTQAKIISLQKHLREIQVASAGKRAREIFWVFREGLAKGVIPSPLSLEIHPHLRDSPRCINACRPCTGQSYDREGNFSVGITPDVFDKLVHDVTHAPDGKRKMRIPKFLFAGNCTEPLLFPNLHKYIIPLVDVGAHVGILTNAVLGYEEIFSVFTNPRLKGTRFFRASLNAATDSHYDYFHRPNKTLISEMLEERGIPLDRDETIFKRAIRNIETLAGMKKQSGIGKNLLLALNFLVYPGNDDEKEVSGLIKWADGIGIDTLEFRMPQIPQMCDLPFEHLSIERTRDFRRFLLAQGQDTKNLLVQVSVNDPLEETKPKPFDQCWTRFILAVIGFDGGLYPCTSVAAPRCTDFSEGNLGGERVDFWSLWNNPDRIAQFMSFSPQRSCDAFFGKTGNPSHVCTRTEFIFNQLLGK